LSQNRVQMTEYSLSIHPSALILLDRNQILETQKELLGGAFLLLTARLMSLCCNMPADAVETKMKKSGYENG